MALNPADIADEIAAYLHFRPASTYPDQKPFRTYAEYLASDIWAEKRQAVMKRDDWTCDCGERASQTHHTRYPKIHGTEPLCWLVAVCRDCHRKIHNL